MKKHLTALAVVLAALTIGACGSNASGDHEVHLTEETCVEINSSVGASPADASAEDRALSNECVAEGLGLGDGY